MTHHGTSIVPPADVLYEGRHYDALLSTLRMLSAAHTISYVGYKRRNADEERFIPLAEAAGFSVEVRSWVLLGRFCFSS